MNVKIKKIILIMLVILISLSTAACNSVQEKSLVVSIPPLKSLTEAIAGETWHVYSLVPTGQNPEDYEPSIEDMIHLEDAQAVMYLAIPAEETTLNKLQSNNPDKLLVNLSALCAQQKDPIYITATQLDPHIWLSPKRALLLSENIRDTLVALDADNAQLYRDNQTELATELIQLDEAWEKAMTEISSRAFVIYHPALSYLALDYNLDMISVEQNGKEPDVGDMNQAIQQAKAYGIQTVFYQQEFPREKVETIASEIDANIVPLSLLDEDYLSMMYQLLDIFKDSL